MIKILKRKIVIFTMLVIGITSIFIASGIAFWTMEREKNNLYSSMDNQIINATKPNNMAGIEIGKNEPNFFIDTQICIIEFNIDTKEISTISKDFYINSSILKSVVIDTISQKKKEGKLNKYSLCYLTKNVNDKIFIAYTDTNYLKTKNTEILLISICVLTIFLTIIFFISLFVAKQSIKPIEKSINDQKRFIADASHELKTPLAVINANTKILLSQSNDNQKEWLNSTSEEITLMTEIISDMLTLAQGEAITSLVKEKINLSKVVNKVCLQFDAIAYEKEINFNYIIDNNIEYECNEKMIKQLFMILIDNALKYENKNGYVDLCLKKINNKIIFEITNKGSYIEKDDLSHIFDRFFRADKSRSTNGVGLGLAIAKNTVDLHCGKISATSSKDYGTKFKVEL